MEENDLKEQCFCCTCKRDVDDNVIQWDAACNNHGAHGLRGCKEHNVAPEICTCGCEDDSDD